MLTSTTRVSRNELRAHCRGPAIDAWVFASATVIGCAIASWLAARATVVLVANIDASLAAHLSANPALQTYLVVGASLLIAARSTWWALERSG